MRLEPPESVRALQRARSRKAKSEPPFRVSLLDDKVYRADVLHHAWALVRANKGAPGVDGVTLAAVEAGGVVPFLARLAEELRTHTDRPDPIRRVPIPKRSGGKRPLGIPTVRDRVVQAAARLVLEPIFEADFQPCSYGFRPKVVCCRSKARQVQTAVAEQLQPLGVPLNRAKTRVLDARQEAFTFPGFTVRVVRSRRTGRTFPLVRPSAPACQRLRDAVKAQTTRAHLARPTADVITALNRVVHGWAGYWLCQPDLAPL